MFPAIPHPRAALFFVLTPLNANLDPALQCVLAHCRELLNAGVGLCRLWLK